MHLDFRRCLFVPFLPCALAPLARAALFNHGPGTSGAGTSVLSGETLRGGTWDLTLRTDWTQFESISRAEAEQTALVHDEFDAIESALIESLTLSYGLTDDLQVGATIGYYWGQDFIDAEGDGLGGVESATADPEGLTDLWLDAKWRFARGPSGHFALVGGIKLPTGVDDEQLSNGEELEPSSQPGSGAVDYQLGLAWSRYLTSHVTLDASGLYTLRTEHDDFQVGDRFDAGLALGYRLTDDVKSFPNFGVSGELNAVWIGKDEESGVENDNSGGTTLYAALGARVRFDQTLALTIAPALPIVQDLNGEQAGTSFKLTAALSFSL